MMIREATPLDGLKCPANSKLFVAVDDAGAVVGYVTTRDVGEHTVAITLIEVEAAHRRCGVGTALIAAAARDYETIVLEVDADNFGARAFYERLVFAYASSVPVFLNGVKQIGGLDSLPRKLPTMLTMILRRSREMEAA